jgi:aryl-alcohol dehydrogenase
MIIKAAVTYEQNAPFVIKEVELEEPREDDVLVRIAACGVCHTDAAVRNQFMPVPLPMVLGHEGAGVVEKVGSAVRTIKPGDHVIMTQNSCGVCEPCITGHPMNCIHVADYNFMGVYPDGDCRLKDADGTPLGAFFSQSSFATYAISDVHNTIVIDKEMDLGLAAPMGCGIQTGAGAVINTLRPLAGSSFAVFGCGGVGLSAVMAAKACGCTEIFAVDTVPGRLRLAEELGATNTINGREVQDSAAAILEATGGRGVDNSLECAGVPLLVNAALNSLAKRGTAALVGTLGNQDVVSKMMETLIKDGRTLIGILEGDSLPQLFIPKLINMYRKGLFPIDKLITFYGFEEIDKAFADSEKGDAIKPVLRF